MKKKAGLLINYDFRYQAFTQEMLFLYTMKIFYASVGHGHHDPGGRVFPDRNVDKTCPERGRRGCQRHSRQFAVPRTVSRLRPPNWLGPCPWKRASWRPWVWAGDKAYFFDHSRRLQISNSYRAFIGHVSEIFHRPLIHCPFVMIASGMKKPIGLFDLWA